MHGQEVLSNQGPHIPVPTSLMDTGELKQGAESLFSGPELGFVCGLIDQLQDLSGQVQALQRSNDGLRARLDRQLPEPQPGLFEVQSCRWFFCRVQLDPKAWEARGVQAPLQTSTAVRDPQQRVPNGIADLLYAVHSGTGIFAKILATWFIDNVGSCTASPLLPQAVCLNLDHVVFAGG